MTERVIDLGITEMRVARCDLVTHRDMSVVAERMDRRLKGKSEIVVVTEAEKVAEIVGIRPEAPTHTEETQITAIITPEDKKRRWDTAVGRACEVIGKLSETDPDRADTTAVTLFEGLRDPDKRDNTINMVETLYEEHFATVEV